MPGKMAAVSKRKMTRKVNLAVKLQIARASEIHQIALHPAMPGPRPNRPRNLASLGKALFDGSHSP